MQNSLLPLNHSLFSRKAPSLILDQVLNTPLINYHSVLTHFFLSGFSFTNIHESQDCRPRGKAFLYLLITTSTHFTDTQTLAGRLLRGAHLCTYQQPGSNQEPLFSERKSLTTKLCSLKSMLSFKLLSFDFLLKEILTLKPLQFYLFIFFTML